MSRLNIELKVRKYICTRANKKGNLAVLLAMLFSCLILIVAVLVNVSTIITSYSYCDAVLQLSGRSVLSEYHLALKENYGLIAFKGYENEIDDKLKFYAEGSFNNKCSNKFFGNENEISLIRPKISKIHSDLRNFTLLEIDNFENEILDYMKYPKLLKKENKEKQVSECKTIINQRIINSLPSKTITDTHPFTFVYSTALPSINELLSKNTGNLIVDEYILNKFNNRFANKMVMDTFFNSEVEYILYGKFSDEENRDKWIGDFKLLRFTFNSLHIWTDSVKRNAVITTAASMSTAAAPITAIILAESWAWAETDNDAKRMLAGKDVALYKNNGQWALTLESVINNTNHRGYINPVNQKGLSYESYLRLFLYFENREIKLLRAMDLMQINMQGAYDETFYIQDCYVGLKFNALINGQEYSYVQIY